MIEYYILSANPHLDSVLDFIRDRGLRCEIHLNRTRFWIDPHSAAFSEFALRFKDSCSLVQDQP